MFEIIFYKKECGEDRPVATLYCKTSAEVTDLLSMYGITYTSDQYYYAVKIRTGNPLFNRWETINIKVECIAATLQYL